METATTVVASAVKDVALSGVLNEMVALIPVILPVCISFIAIRKGISFLMSSLHNA